MKKIVTKFTFLFLLFAVLVIPIQSVAADTGCFNDSGSGNINSSLEISGNITTKEKEVVSLVNSERMTAGLQPLSINEKLAEVAQKKAEDMRDKNYFSHTSNTYGSPFDMMKSFGIIYKTAGENIAKGYNSPATVMKGWMNSQGHRDNILNNAFTDIGVGQATDSKGNTYWVQMFIRP